MASGSRCRTERWTSSRRTTHPIRCTGRRPRTSSRRTPGCRGQRRWALSCTARAFATGRIGLGRFLELVASGPARVFGLERKGRLEAGADADFVVFDPDAEWTLDESEMHYAVGWSPYQGRPVRGRVASTWLRGRCVYEQGQVRAEPGSGRFVAAVPDTTT